MKLNPHKLWQSLRDELPSLGLPGSRSAELHISAQSASPHHTDLKDGSKIPTLGEHHPYQGGSALINTVTGADLLDPAAPPKHKAENIPVAFPRERAASDLTFSELRRFAMFRWMGALGALLLGFGALGAGALPVVNNPYTSFIGGSIMARMLQSSMIVCFIGVALLVISWLLIAPFTGALPSRTRQTNKGDDARIVSMSLLWRTFAAWSLPILLSAPMFTQDIYSYLANGAIVRMGLDPYSAGPIDLLGTDHPLARSVPFIWAHSPSPYGPVALGLASLISHITGDSIAWGVFLHRTLSIAGIALAGWAISRLATRCRVAPQAALWLGILNPLTILHLVGGIHNEAILLGLLLAGFELGLRGCNYLRVGIFRHAALYIGASGLLISCAGMVKVTGFIGLGFTGMAIARSFRFRERSHSFSLACAVGIQIALLILSILVITFVSGIGLGWVHAQGGAVAIRSWMSLSTAVGVAAGWFGMLLGLGDQTEAMLQITRGCGILLAGVFMLRMLLATYWGRIPAIGGLGVATFVLVVFFPVVHPWYMLWAILPLSAWANRAFFRMGVTLYSALLSFFVLPRGLSLPPSTVLSIYFASALGLSVLLFLLWWSFKRARR
ncbi:polyprenol phosphomannose-dependent alpha 1,6 mannosyltransferase MptB [Corynebacterium ulcerans]|uniref:polyprenol phosphomannose-dependent alpha 1,6 mannosyltransferase MptB n=1 Tax=Corynebacterium ulcerans TaxID=65058 RepID=UPI00051F731A|nr:polyprenol phosphomannose-dependent alpha 1,6 mannosyltransferase MptB [Corynebacterium ulcerans]AIT89207.1 Hypothetical protein Cul210932_1261 [Corynebacterium ulcerans]ALD94981.1 Hypothetical protein Cul131001_1277 [Corynebacterium ulcerans]SQG58830.1 carotene biosynthesis associated membrane protein [Corynebacterium ulcerans]